MSRLHDQSAVYWKWLLALYAKGTEQASLASFYFTGTILIRHNIYTVIFMFNLIKSRVRVRIRIKG